MQSELSTLQKAIMIYIFENKHDLVSNTYSFNNIVFYHELGKQLAEDFGKLIPGNREPFIVSPLFSVSLGNSIDSLIKQDLVIEYPHEYNERPFISLTEKGNETAKELLDFKSQK